MGHVITSTVKDGPQSYIYATIYEIIDPADRSHHHWCLKLDSCNRSKRLGWTFKPEKSLTIEGAPSLQVLANLVKATITGQLAQKTGDFHLIPAEQLQSIRGLLRFAETRNCLYGFHLISHSSSKTRKNAAKALQPAKQALHFIAFPVELAIIVPRLSSVGFRWNHRNHAQLQHPVARFHHFRRRDP